MRAKSKHDRPCCIVKVTLENLMNVFFTIPEINAVSQSFLIVIIIYTPLHERNWILLCFKQLWNITWPPLYNYEICKSYQACSKRLLHFHCLKVTESCERTSFASTRLMLCYILIGIVQSNKWTIRSQTIHLYVINKNYV